MWCHIESNIIILIIIYYCNNISLIYVTKILKYYLIILNNW